MNEMTWTNDDLHKIAEKDDLHIAPFREDGITYGTPTWIWSVVVDDGLYVRAYHGQSSRWYQAAMRHRGGRITAAGMTKDVTFEPVDGAVNDRIDDAYRAKYKTSPYLKAMISDRARSATVRVTLPGPDGPMRIGRRTFCLVAAGCAFQEAVCGKEGNQKRSNNMEIKRAGSQPSAKGPSEWFTGSVRIDPLFQAPDPAFVQGASVTFEPGARTTWHTHPLGQTLIVTAGLGWAQRAGGPVEEIRPGDVVWFAPGEKHWHGASPTTGMTHIAIQEKKDGKVVEWMEHVSDEQYRK